MKHILNNAVPDKNSNRELPPWSTCAIYCDHANEMPAQCTCLPDCYCRVMGSCRNRPAYEFEHQEPEKPKKKTIKKKVKKQTPFDKTFQNLNLKDPLD